MKTKSVLIALSLAANVVLALVYFQPAFNTQQPVSTTHAAASSIHSTFAAWIELLNTTANDDAAFIARLRAEGFPPAVIRAIVSARVSDRFAARRHELTKAAGKLNFWQTFQAFQPNDNLGARAALRQLQREQTTDLRQLLGDDATPEYLRAAIAQRNGGLSNDKAEQLDWIKRDYAELTSQLNAEIGGIILEEDHTKFALLEKEQRADMAALLSPSELEAYELRSSPIATKIKSKLDLLNLTEQEYLTLYRLHKGFYEKLSFDPQLNPEKRSRDAGHGREIAEKQLEQEIKTALGPDRYADYQMVTDFDYRTIHQVTERLNLPPATAKAVYQIKRDSIARGTELSTFFAHDPQKLKTEQARVSQENTAKLISLVGAEGVDALRESSFYWRSLPASQT